MNNLDAFKNELEYFAANGNFKTTVAAMDWALGEIERLRAALQRIVDEAESDDGLSAWNGRDIAFEALEQSAAANPDEGLPTADDVRGILTKGY